MPAPKGNKNAEKYTLEFVQCELKKLLKELQDDYTIVYLGELFLEKEYSRSRFHEWIKKYGEDDVVSCTFNKIMNILETRVAKGAIYDQFNASFTKFHLINNFHWKDKTEIDHTSNNQELKALTEKVNRDLADLEKEFVK